MHYFEVRKLPTNLDAENELQLLLSLFRAKTEEELNRLKELEVPVVSQAIEAYRTVMASDEFKELERLRFLASCNEASALEHARRKERKKLQGALDKKDAIIADKDATIAAVVADKDAALADKDAEIMRLRAMLDNLPN
jgi:predicted nucleic acid-binding protein